MRHSFKIHLWLILYNQFASHMWLGEHGLLMPQPSKEEWKWLGLRWYEHHNWLPFYLWTNPYLLVSCLSRASYILEHAGSLQPHNKYNSVSNLLQTLLIPHSFSTKKPISDSSCGRKWMSWALYPLPHNPLSLQMREKSSVLHLIVLFEMLLSRGNQFPHGKQPN